MLSMRGAMAARVSMVLVTISGFSVVSCGGDDDGGAAGSGADAAPPPRPDAAVFPDAGPFIECPDGELGDLGRLDGSTALMAPQDRGDPDGPQVRSLLGSFGSILFSLRLLDGRGAFAGGGSATGTFALEAEAAPDTCGICLNFNLPADPIPVTVLPVSGSITLDSVDGRLTGSFVDLALQQLDRSGEPVEGGCVATALGGSFDARFLMLP
jgi:hypothetical protein